MPERLLRLSPGPPGEEAAVYGGGDRPVARVGLRRAAGLVPAGPTRESEAPEVLPGDQRLL